MAIYPQRSMNHAVRKGGISSFFDLFVIWLTDVSISGLKKKKFRHPKERRRERRKRSSFPQNPFPLG